MRLFLAVVLFFLRIIEDSGKYTAEIWYTVDHFSLGSSYF